MRIQAKGAIVAAAAVAALIVGVFVFVAAQIGSNVVEGVSEGIEGSSEVINGPSLDSTLAAAVDDFGGDAVVVGLTIRPQDMVYEVLTGSEVTERRIFVQETSRFDPAENREISGATVTTRDSTRRADRGERRAGSPTLGEIDPAAQDRMAAAAGVPASRLTAELDGDRWLVSAADGKTIKLALDGACLSC